MSYITQNDLIDLHAVFVNLRNTPDDPRAEDILTALSDALRADADGENRFRHALAALRLPEGTCWDFAHHDNVYVYHVFIKDPALPALLNRALGLMLDACRARAYEKLSDLADALHNLPAAFCENGYRIPGRFCKQELKRYRQKWGEDLLSYT